MSSCAKCKQAFAESDEEEKEEEDSFICDICDEQFHTACTDIRKMDINARKNSKCLRLLCPDCYESTDKLLEKRVDEMIKIAYKIDHCCQQRKETEHRDSLALNAVATTLATLCEKFDKLNEKVDSLESKSNAPTPAPANVMPSNMSYAKVVTTKPAKPAVVIKPKQKQHSKKTMEELTSLVDKNAVSVCNTRNIRDGGVVLLCNNMTETMKVKQIVHDKLGDGYDVILPAVKDPRLRITNIDTDIPDDSIINQLKSNNEQIKDFELKLVTIIPRNYRGKMSNDIIVEVKCDAYKTLLEMGVLYLPWNTCNVYEHLYLKRCFKCCGFSHIAQQCEQNAQYCSKCAGNHKFDSCKSKKLCCINCKVANERSNLKLDTGHHSWSKECSVLQRRLAILRGKIEYNPAE